METVINGVMPAVTAAFVGVIIVIIKNVGDALIKLAEVKAKELGQKYKLDKYLELINTAKDIWNIVEEKFRITENVEELVYSKADMFDKLLLKKVPALTQGQLDEIRQALAGEYNKGKSALSEDDLKKENLKLQESNKNLENENKSLKDQLNKVQEVIKISEVNEETAGAEQ